MDHAIDKISIYFDITIEELYAEWNTGQYQKLTECPSYGEASAYRKAIGVMKKFYYGSDYKMPSMKECLKQHIWLTQDIQIDWKNKNIEEEK